MLFFRSSPDFYLKPFSRSSLPSRFTCTEEKKEVMFLGSTKANIGVAQLWQVSNLSLYTQTFAPIGWFVSEFSHSIGQPQPLMPSLVSKRHELTSQHPRRYNSCAYPLNGNVPLLLWLASWGGGVEGDSWSKATVVKRHCLRGHCYKCSHWEIEGSWGNK